MCWHNCTAFEIILAVVYILWWVISQKASCFFSSSGSSTMTSMSESVVRGPLRQFGIIFASISENWQHLYSFHHKIYSGCCRAVTCSWKNSPSWRRRCVCCSSENGSNLLHPSLKSCRGETKTGLLKLRLVWEGTILHCDRYTVMTVTYMTHAYSVPLRSYSLTVCTGQNWCFKYPC